MSDNNQILYIVSALSASKKAMFYADNFNSPDEFFEANEQLNFNATLVLLIAVGEAVKKIDNEILKSQSNIPWHKVAAMRNILAHDYRGTDVEILFDVIKVELPKLVEAFISFLQLFPKNEVEEIVASKYYKNIQNIVFKN